MMRWIIIALSCLLLIPVAQAQNNGIYMELAGLVSLDNSRLEIPIDDDSHAWARPVYARAAIQYRRSLSPWHAVNVGLVHISNPELWKPNFNAVELGLTVKLF